jgi:hypothetical protein
LQIDQCLVPEMTVQDDGRRTMAEIGVFRKRGRERWGGGGATLLIYNIVNDWQPVVIIIICGDSDGQITIDNA